ncbi:MAG: hypothetical protein ACI9BK_002567 [Acidimicrobiales bacterium]
MEEQVNNVHLRIVEQRPPRHPFVDQRF